ncbi:Protein of unknown function DUF247, plant, partial [Cynara cardunculus var. scolymus]
MDMLVDTQDDIVKMVDSEVLINHLGTNQDAANMISSICENVILRDFYYNQQWNQLYSYYNGYWPKNIARLRRTYFSSPWNFIALVAGIILFGLTAVQTDSLLTAFQRLAFRGFLFLTTFPKFLLPPAFRGYSTILR